MIYSPAPYLHETSEHEYRISIKEGTGTVKSVQEGGNSRPEENNVCPLSQYKPTRINPPTAPYHQCCRSLREHRWKKYIIQLIKSNLHNLHSFLHTMYSAGYKQCRLRDQLLCLSGELNLQPTSLTTVQLFVYTFDAMWQTPLTKKTSNPIVTTSYTVTVWNMVMTIFN